MKFLENSEVLQRKKQVKRVFGNKLLMTSFRWLTVASHSGDFLPREKNWYDMVILESEKFYQAGNHEDHSVRIDPGFFGPIRDIQNFVDTCPVQDLFL